MKLKDAIACLKRQRVRLEQVQRNAQSSLELVREMQSRTTGGVVSAAEVQTYVDAHTAASDDVAAMDAAIAELQRSSADGYVFASARRS